MILGAVIMCLSAAEIFAADCHGDNHTEKRRLI